MACEEKILADSIASGVRLTTHLVTFPRFILAEVNTHRVFSRNSASSRAIPVEKRIFDIIADPFIPAAFGANKKGMQAGPDLDEGTNAAAEYAWREAMQDAISAAQSLAKLGVHKQWANRLLEPFAWHTAIITATEYDNFFALRCNPEASPEFRKIAEMMRDAMKLSKPVELQPGDWHLPLVFDEDLNGASDRFGSLTVSEALVRLSVARCARVSYLTHEGKRDVEADLALYDRLLTSGHMSPFEHAAKVYDGGSWDDAGKYAGWKHDTFIGNFRAPWVSHRKQIPGEDVWKPK
jgi:thymidylate synthase ThyX